MNGTIILLPVGRHPYISVLKQIGDVVETSEKILNALVTNGVLRWYMATDLASLFPSMI